MTDLSIRRVTIAEQAFQAALRFVQTGESESNPHAGTPDEQAWRSAFERNLLALTAPEAEASA